jgi:hypothetical protein
MFMRLTYRQKEADWAEITPGVKNWKIAAA